MPADLFRRIDLDKLYPPFLERALELAARCRARGHDFFAISGYRSPEEQAKLYFQGRTMPGKIVTNAKPWRSAHQYGIAIDFCLDADTKRAGLQPDWALEKYEILREEAEKLGLESGLSWKSFREGPHIQLDLDSRNITLGMLHGRVEQTLEIKSAWHLLDAQPGKW